MKSPINWKKEIPWDKYKWAKFACISKKGTIKLFRDKPLCVESNGYWWERWAEAHYKNTREYKALEKKGEEDEFPLSWTSEDDYAFKGDWKESLIKRPKNLQIITSEAVNE